LAAAVAGGAFREDLLYRLNVIEVLLPALRERHRDIQPLAEHLLRFFARQAGKPAPRITDEARAAMVRYPWPGNIRELRNAIERGIILASGSEVGLADLPAQIGATLPQSAMVIGGAVTLEQLEAEHIRRVLTTTPTIEQAATLLGIDPSTLYRKRKRYGL
jgi:NtrC-family two-component system response regulator AlgB